MKGKSTNFKSAVFVVFAIKINILVTNLGLISNNSYKFFINDHAFQFHSQISINLKLKTKFIFRVENNSPHMHIKTDSIHNSDHSKYYAMVREQNKK